MLPIVLATFSSDPQKSHFEQKSNHDVEFAGKTYSFAAIQDQAFEIERSSSEVWVLMGPTGSGKTTTLKKYLRLYASLNGRMSACEVSCNTFFVDLLDGKTRKRYLSHVPVEKQLKESQCLEENIQKVFSLRNTASTKSNAQLSRSCMLVTLKGPGGKLTILDMMGNEKFEANAATSNVFANSNVSSITQALLNRTSTKRSSNLVTNMIFNNQSLLKLKFILHLDKAGDPSLIKSSLNNIADVVKGFRVEQRAEAVKTESKLPLYARPTAASLSPKKRVPKRSFVVSSKQPLKQPRLAVTKSDQLTQKLRQAQLDGINEKVEMEKQEQPEKEKVEKDERIEQMRALRQEVLVLKEEVKKARLATVPLKEQIGQFKSLFQEAEERTESLCAEKERLKEELTEKAKEIENAMVASNEAEETIQKLKTDMEEAEKSFKTRTDENEQLQMQIQLQISILTEKGVDLNQQIGEKSRLIADLEKQMELAEQTKKEEITSLQNKLNVMEKKVSDTETKHRALADKSSQQESELTANASHIRNLLHDSKKQELLSKQKHEFFQQRLENMRHDNLKLNEQVAEAKDEAKKLRERNELLARNMSVLEHSESQQKSKITELREKVEELEKYKTKCEHLDSSLQELRVLSQTSEEQLLKKVLDYKQKYKKILNEQAVPRLFRLEIHEDTDYKTYLKHKRGEARSSPLKERNIDRESRRHSLKASI